jgi:leucyl-tRNA synthetase
MSKSKGNVVDPLGLIDKYGADALRFFMAAMESQGRDVKMDERRVELSQLCHQAVERGALLPGQRHCGQPAWPPPLPPAR